MKIFVKIDKCLLYSDVVWYMEECHARMREILSYLHIPTATSVFYMYEATIVNKKLMQVL